MPEKPPEPPVVYFQPASGGDMTLRSSNGVTFCVHSILMSLASSVFKDMLSVGAKSDEIIELADEAKHISLMLEYIYPTKTPTITSLAIFEQALRIAQKYDVKCMMDILDEQLCLGAKSDIVSRDPLHACALAYSFGLMKATEIIARVVDLKVNLRSPRGITRLVKLPLDQKLVTRLIGMQAMRAEAPSHTLFNYDQHPMNYYGRHDSTFPRCYACNRASTITVPTWILRWSKSVYELALSHNLDELPSGLKIEDAASVYRLVNYEEHTDDEPKPCLDCLSYARADDGEYSWWAGAVLDDIQAQLRTLRAQFSLSPV